MGRGRLWRRNGRRLWRWPGGGGSANRPWSSGSREGHPPAASPSTPPPLPAAEGPSQCRPGAPCGHPASPRHTQPSGWAGPWRMDLWGAVQTGRMSLWFYQLSGSHDMFLLEIQSCQDPQIYQQNCWSILKSAAVDPHKSKCKLLTAEPHLAVTPFTSAAHKVIRPGWEIHTSHGPNVEKP